MTTLHNLETGRGAGWLDDCCARTRQPGVIVLTTAPAADERLAGYLTGHGFDVWMAGCEDEALDLLLRHRASVDVLLIDTELLEWSALGFGHVATTRSPDVTCIFRATEGGPLFAELLADGAEVVSKSAPPAEVLECLCEAVAFHAWAGEDGHGC